MWTTAEESVRIPIEFLVDDQLAIPDEAVITIRDWEGNVIPPYNEAPLSVDSTTATFVFPGIENLVDPSRLFETRYFSVKYRVLDIWYDQHGSFSTTRFVPITVTRAQIRAELGLMYHEMPDEEIEVMPSYVALVEEYGVNFDDALRSRDRRALAANRAICLLAALSKISVLEMKAHIFIKSEDHQMRRRDDFNTYEMRLQLGRSLGYELEIALNQNAIRVPSLSLSNPTDAITGG